MWRLTYRITRFSRFLFGTLNRDLKLIFASNLIGAFGDGLYAYIFPLYIRALGADPTEVGVVFSLLFFVAALTPLPGGILADKYDRKKLMILGWLLWIPIPLMFSVAEHWTHMLLGAALYGIMLSGPATSAYIATMAHKGKMTQTFTLISVAWWLGYIFSPAIGGYLSTTVGMRWVFRLSSVLFVVSTVFFYLSAASMRLHILSGQPLPFHSNVRKYFFGQFSSPRYSLSWFCFDHLFLSFSKMCCSLVNFKLEF